MFVAGCQGNYQVLRTNSLIGLGSEHFEYNLCLRIPEFQPHGQLLIKTKTPILEKPKHLAQRVYIGLERGRPPLQ